MTPYKIFETENFRKELRLLIPSREQTLIQRKMKNLVFPRLREQPHFGNHIKKLKNYEPESWRYRIGDFRIFYSIDEKEKVVVLTAIRWRKDAYR